MVAKGVHLVAREHHCAAAGLPEPGPIWAMAVQEPSPAGPVWLAVTTHSARTSFAAAPFRLQFAAENVLVAAAPVVAEDAVSSDSVLTVSAQVKAEMVSARGAAAARGRVNLIEKMSTLLSKLDDLRQEMQCAATAAA